MDPEEGISTDTTATDASAGGETQQGTDGGGSGHNPAFDPIRSELGDLAFSRIEKHLKDFDSNNNKRFEKVQTDFKWAKELRDSGVTPERVQASLAFAQNLDDDPVGLYERLGQFLQQNGRLPQTQAEVNAVANGDEDPDDDEQTPEDPRLAQALQDNAQIKAFLAQQAAAEQAREADLALDSELDALKTAHPELAREDIREILQRSVFFAQQGKELPLEEIAQDYIVNVRNRILGAQRPGDTAPRLVPTTGGNAAQAQPKPYSSMSRGETQDLIAGLIAQGNQREG